MNRKTHSECSSRPRITNHFANWFALFQSSLQPKTTKTHNETGQINKYSKQKDKNDGSYPCFCQSCLPVPCGFSCSLWVNLVPAMCWFDSRSVSSSSLIILCLKAPVLLVSVCRVSIVYTIVCFISIPVCPMTPLFGWIKDLRVFIRLLIPPVSNCDSFCHNIMFYVRKAHTLSLPLSLLHRQFSHTLT